MQQVPYQSNGVGESMKDLMKVMKTLSEADVVIDRGDYLVAVRLPEEMASSDKKKAMREIMRILMRSEETPQEKEIKSEK
jgi:hypothetical protein